MGCGTSTSSNDLPSKPMSTSSFSSRPRVRHPNTNPNSNTATKNAIEIHPPKKQVDTSEKYTIIKVLGEGASCKVLSVKDKSTGRSFAMKVLNKSESYNQSLYENEVHILNTLRHENVLELVDYYEDKRSYHILTVLYGGGELFDRVKNGSFSEKHASQLTRQMLRALSYCHSHNIVHRDLKPENFVFSDMDFDNNSSMKLIDFGCAKVVDDSSIVADVAGSPYYVAPEILIENFKRTGLIWKASDMWSVGVIVFLLVCGYPPFNADSQEEIFRKISRGKYRFPMNADGTHALSESVRQLVSSLLQMNPKNRITSDKALEHPWVVGDTASSTPLPSSIIDALTAFRSQCRLKKAVARVLSNRMTVDDKEQLAMVFKQFDKNGDGQLGPEEIRRMMHHIGKNEKEAKELMEAMDEDGSGGVSIDEFATGMQLGKLGSGDDAEMKMTFDLFDADGDGFVTLKEIEKICDFLTPDAATGLIHEVDRNGDGKINLDEWIKAMKEIDSKIGGPKKTNTNNGNNALSPPAAITGASTSASEPARPL